MTAEDEKLLGRLVALRSDAAANHVIELACVFDDVIARIRELSAEVNEAKKDYALLELETNEYEEGRDRNAELWERVKAERDRLAGENAKLREALEAAIKQLEHVETLRAMDWGPVPETLTPDVIADAKSALAQAGQELADALAAQRKEGE